MRWKTKVYRDGDKRVRKFFAFFPVCVWGRTEAETRWLQRVTVLEKFVVSWSDSYWITLKFIDENECK